ESHHRRSSLRAQYLGTPTKPAPGKRGFLCRNPSCTKTSRFSGVIVQSPPRERAGVRAARASLAGDEHDIYHRAKRCAERTSELKCRPPSPCPLPEGEGFLRGSTLSYFSNFGISGVGSSCSSRSMMPSFVIPSAWA